MPTTAVQIYSNGGLQPWVDPENAQMISVALAANTTFPQGCVLGPVTASPGTYAPYASGNTDGSQNPTLILKFACVTDASGNITSGSQSGGGEWGQTLPVAPAYFKGTFRTQDMPQSGAGSLDANAITKLNGHLLQGTTVAGILHIG